MYDDDRDVYNLDEVFNLIYTMYGSFDNLHKATNISRTYLYNMKNKGAAFNPSVRFIKLLADALNIHAGDLFDAFYRNRYRD